MLDFLNVKVGDSRELLKHVENYRLYAENETVFVLPATAFKDDKLYLDYTDLPPVEDEHLSIAFHNGKGKVVEIMKTVGTNVYFTLIRKDNGVYVPSRYTVQQRVHDEIMSLPLGTILEGQAWSSNPNVGEFIDIGAGVLALCPYNLLSVSRTPNCCKRFYKGEKVYAILHSKENNRFTCSMLPLFGTFQDNADRFTVGGTHIGVVTSNSNIGTFVELAPNLVGLTPAPIPNVECGDHVVVYIHSIAPETGKVKLDFIDKSDVAVEPCTSFYTDLVNAGSVGRWDYNPVGTKTKTFDYGG